MRVAHDTDLPLWEHLPGGPEAGEPTEHAHEVYSYGDCWALAWHLARLTGGRLCVLGPWGENPRRAQMWHHVVVDMSHVLEADAATGAVYLDVEGLHTRAALEADWDQPLTPVPAAAAADVGAYTRALGATWEYLDPASGHGETAEFARQFLRAGLDSMKRQDAAMGSAA